MRTEALEQQTLRYWKLSLYFYDRGPQYPVITTEDAINICNNILRKIPDRRALGHQVTKLQNEIIYHTQDYIALQKRK